MRKTSLNQGYTWKKASFIVCVAFAAVLIGMYGVQAKGSEKPVKQQIRQEEKTMLQLVQNDIPYELYHSSTLRAFERSVLGDSSASTTATITPSDSAIATTTDPAGSMATSTTTATTNTATTTNSTSTASTTATSTSSSSTDTASGATVNPPISGGSSSNTASATSSPDTTNKPPTTTPKPKPATGSAGGTKSPTKPATSTTATSTAGTVSSSTSGPIISSFQIPESGGGGAANAYYSASGLVNGNQKLITIYAACLAALGGILLSIRYLRAHI